MNGPLLLSTGYIGNFMSFSSVFVFYQVIEILAYFPSYLHE